VALNAQPITDLTKMKKQENKNPKPNNKNSITNNFIILIFSIISLFFESVIIIISLFKNGLVKKEILSKKTDLGFDLIIKRK
jgi:Sec-independent protein secretion pathway component TatC